MALWSPAEKKRFKKLKEEGCVVTVSAEVPQAEFDDELQNVFVRLQARARLPGFRPGKAPLDLIKSQFGSEARAQALEECLRKAMPGIVKDLDLHPVASPTVSDISFDPGKPITFQVVVENAPRFEPADYKKIPVVAKAAASGPADVEQRLEDIRQGNARLEKSSSEAVGTTDYAIVDYEGAVDGKFLEGSKAENELIDMSAPQTVAGLSEGILGAKRGDIREVDVDLQGKKARFKVTLKEIKTKVVPSLDDEFAKDLGLASVAELRSKVAESLEREAKQKTEREIREAIDKHLLKANPIPLPPSLVEAQLESMIERFKRDWAGSGRPWPQKDESKLRDKLRADAETTIRLSYIYQAVARRESIEATEEDFQKEVAENLERVADNEKNDVRKFLESRKEDVQAVLRERKVVAFLKDSAAIKTA